jgi:ribosomal protein S18 acetylase RimI-like enzyme
LCYGKDFLHQRTISKIFCNLNSNGFVLVDHYDHVLGYILYLTHDSSVEILRLGIHPYYRRKQHGTRLLNRVKYRLNSKIRKLNIVIPDTLTSGQLFLRDQGFICSKTIPSYFTKSKREGYSFTFYREWMPYKMDDAPLENIFPFFAENEVFGP